MDIKRILKNNNPFATVVPAFLWQLLFFYLPILLIIFTSFSSIDNYLIFFKSIYLVTILKSAFYAFITASICFLLGYPLAYFISLKVTSMKPFFLFLLMLPFWTNFLLHVYAWFYILEPTGFLNNLLIYFNIIGEPLELLNSIYGIITVMVYCYLPFMVLPIYTILERFDKRLIEASLDLGANLWQTLIHVILPLSKSGIRTGFFLVLVPAFAEFAIPSLIGGDKYVFVGNIIAQYILANRTLGAGSAFTIISCIMLTLLILAALIIIKLARYYFNRDRR